MEKAPDRMLAPKAIFLVIPEWLMTCFWEPFDWPANVAQLNLPCPPRGIMRTVAFPLIARCSTLVCDKYKFALLDQYKQMHV